MKKEPVKVLPKTLLFFIDLSILILVGALIALPYVFRMLPVRILSIHFFGDSYQSSLIFFMVCTALFLAIINETRKVLKTLVRGSVFGELNPKYFRRIAVLSYILAGVFLYKTIVDFSMPTPLMSLTFIFLGLFSHVLSYLFINASTEKENPPKA
ncbi:MAG: hypothetical protein AB1Z19_07485 [Eubacteriales bacterium]